MGDFISYEAQQERSGVIVIESWEFCAVWQVSAILLGKRNVKAHVMAHVVAYVVVIIKST